MKKTFCILTLTSLIFNLFAEVSNGAEKFAVRNIYGDNMVLQRNCPIKICGTADKGKNIKVTIAENSVTTTADTDGIWQAELPAMLHGGPYELKIEGANKIINFKNILIGDVWICSGQSNMAMPVWSNRPFWSSKNGLQEAQNANYPEIRLFNVPVTFSPGKELQQAPTKSQWQVCNPESVKPFSAAGFYFARELYRELKIPIGMINCSRGSSKIEPWISKTGYQTKSQQKNLEKILYAEKNDISLNGKSEAIAKWWTAILKDHNQQFIAAKKWKNRNYDDRKWKKVTAEDNISSEYGAVWYRCNLKLPADWQGNDLVISLGVLGGFDTVYFNGIIIGETPISEIAPEKKQRTYTIRKTLIKNDNNVVAIRLLKIDNSKDFFKPLNTITIKNIKNGKILTITENWKRQSEFELDGAKIPPRPTSVTANEFLQYPATLYNAMVAPFTAFSIKGVIWYQGCSNAKEYRNYFELHQLLIQDWRNKWNNPELSFIITQLSANERVSPSNRLPDNFWCNRPPQDYDWAKLREIQTTIMQKISNVGMAVTIDRGDHSDIHPADKQTVGYRLAREALRVAYNFNGITAGPLYKSMQIEGDKIRLYFDNIGSGLEMRGDKLTAFAIAGADGKFVWAHAVIEGDTVVVKSDKIKSPKHVRYAWAKYPGDITFFNKDGFPASPFRTDKADYLQ